MPDIFNTVTNIADRLNNRLIWQFARTRRPIPTERPIVSFTFDDVPDTALTNGAAILEKYGVHGTFYIAGGLEGRIEPDRRLISADGCRELFSAGTRSRLPYVFP
ncbi:polysaccharide deacetylase family protein [Rhizobium sp. RCAM05350]|nr:polysaccharide deacetylase family protein [Rhizobium sp. RCAM05350]